VWGWIAIFILMTWALVVMVGIEGITLYMAWLGDLTYLGDLPKVMLVAGLVGPVVAGLPLLLGLFVRGRRPRAMLYAMMVATVASFVFLLPRAIFSPTPSYVPMLVRTALGALVGVGLVLWARRKERLELRDATVTALAVFLGLVFLVPWLRFGALGNLVDTFVAALQAVGLSLTMVGLAANLLPQLTETSDSTRRNLLLGGITLFVAFAMLGSAWGQMDYQMLLVLAVPAVAFSVALVGVRAGRYPLWAGLAVAFPAMFGPLAWFDPMELHIGGFFAKEVAWFGFIAGAIVVAVGLLVAIVSVIAGETLFRPRLAGVWTALAGIAGLVAIAVYLTLGHPGLYGDDFFVVMKSQADLTAARSIGDVEERRAWVYDTLVAEADTTQADLIRWLDGRGIPYTRYYLVNAIAVHGSVIARWQIERRADVAKVLYDPVLRPLETLPPNEPGNAEAPSAPTWGLDAMGVPRVWKEFGARGAGVVVGQSDSGADATHPALADGYRGAIMGTDDYNWLDSWFGKPQPYDGNGHGTHTLGTAVGNDLVGVAPDATWFGCINLGRAFGNISHYLDCMQFMLAPYPPGGDPFRDGRPDLAADVSNNSWGCTHRVEGCDQETLLPAVRAMRAAGIFVVAAIGNEGPECGSAETPPGNYSGTLMSVGAMTPDGTVADFSSRGPITDSPDGGRTPDLIAPGVDVVSAWPGGGWFDAEGTSMAGPHVTGVVALMWSANPALRGHVEETEQILLDTADPGVAPPTDACGTSDERPNPDYGYGIVNAYEAVKRAVATTP